MTRLPDDLLLSLWESGLSSTPSARALDVLRSVSGSDPGAQTVGRHDAALLALYADSFGPVLDAVADCPGCGQGLDIALPVQALGSAAAQSDTVRVETDGYVVLCHVPTVAEVAALSDEMATGVTASSAAADALLSACVDSAWYEGAPVEAGDLPGHVREEAEGAMARADRAEIRVNLTCPSCGCQWVEILDLAIFVCTGLDRAARCLVDDVQTLAASYGWSERDILAMTPARRRLYLTASSR